MSNLTPNLGLFKYDVDTDGKEVFSLTQALNNNWDILDTSVGKKSGLDLISNAVTKGTNPSSTSYWGIRFNDGSNRETWQAIRLGIIECSLDTSGTTQLQIGAYKNEDNATGTSSILLKHMANGTKDINFNVNSVSGAVAEIKCVTQTYVNGTSWYRVWSDGWIEQGGRWNVNNAQDVTTTINLAKSFSNTNYTITLGAYQTSHVGSQESIYSEPSTTNFKLHVYGYYTKYVYWYACGY